MTFLRAACVFYILITTSTLLTGIQSSNSVVQHHMDIELRVKSILETNIERIPKLIQQLKISLLKLTAKSYDVAKEDFLASPLAALVMVRRLAEDWTALTRLVGKTHDISSFGLGEIRWPGETEILTAAKAVMRAQMTYDLDTDLLVQGVETQRNLPSNLTAADCFRIAEAYHSIYQYAQAVTWLQEALNKLHDDESTELRNVALQYMASALCYLGNEKDSQHILTNLDLKDSLNSITERLFQGIQDLVFNKDCKQLFEKVRRKQTEAAYLHVDNATLETHKRLCQGHGKQDTKLRCRYVHYQQPHLRIQPFKLEELYLEPPVIRFHGAITDGEIDALKGLSKPLLAPSKLSGGGLSEYRKSHVAWIGPGVSDAGDRLTLRISEMTRLNAFAAEYHQVSRYSLTGEYLPHKDFFGSAVPFVQDRIATLMFYLNDVKEGGNTVFTKLELVVPPIKNSAVLWFNYFRNGESDHNTIHSGCPTLLGTKWVCNKWFYNGGNEFSVPCGLREDSSFTEYYTQ